jgi:predicted nucleic acid-binding protein
MRSTTAEFFLDTNILLYAVSTASRESSKAETALHLLDSVEFGLSTQVLQEFYAVATGKLRQQLSAAAGMRLVEQWSTHPLCIVDEHIILAAIRLQQHYRISYWDAAIVAAAHELKARIVYSEDFQHQQFYGDVQVINPFIAAKA